MPLPLFATSSATRTVTRGAAPKKRGHVAVCPFFQPPHPETFFLLGHKIAAANRDVQVTVFVPAWYGMYLYWYWNPEEDHNLAFYPVGELDKGSSGTPQLRAYLEEIGADLRSSMARAEEEYGPKISYLVADAFLADVCRGIADERRIRWSAVWPSSDVSIAAYMHGDLIRERSGVSFPLRPIVIPPPVLPVPAVFLNGSSQAGARSFQMVDEFLPGFPPGIALNELPHGSIIDPENLEFYPLAEMFHGMVRSLPKADAVVVDSFAHLEPSVFPALLGPNVHLGGVFPLTLPFPPAVDIDDSEGIFPWLDAAPAGSVVYISLKVDPEKGFAPSEPEFHALAEALEATGVRFLWHVAPTWPRVSLPEGFVERAEESGQGKVVTRAWSPVRLLKLEHEVLRHAAVGAQMRLREWWPFAESLAAGKPIICTPHPFGLNVDQQLNFAMVERVWGIGIQVDGWGHMRSSAEKVLRTVMLEEEGRKMKERAAKLGKLAKEDAHGSSAQTWNKFLALVTK